MDRAEMWFWCQPLIGITRFGPINSTWLLPWQVWGIVCFMWSLWACGPRVWKRKIYAESGVGFAVD